jgi:hypothetical protein
LPIGVAGAPDAPYSPTLPRPAFTDARRAFPSRRRVTEARVGRVARRAFGGTATLFDQLFQPAQRLGPVLLQAAELLRLDDHHPVLADALVAAAAAAARGSPRAGTTRRCRSADAPRSTPC